MEASTVDTRMARAGTQAYWLLRAGLVALPLLAGIDKFFNWTVDWPVLSRRLDRRHRARRRPRTSCTSSERSRSRRHSSCWSRRAIGGPLVAAWLAGITINLLTADAPEYYDIALRDFGLFLAAVTFSRLAWAYHGGSRSRPGPAAAPSSHGNASRRRSAGSRLTRSA